MKKLTLFNHKGGVGKTTLTVNIATTLGAEGLRVLLVDADPQCNLTSFFLDEDQLENLFESSDEDGESDGGTLWSSIRPVMKGKGGVKEVPVYQTSQENVFLLPGDVLLADYEEELPDAWTGSFARRDRSYDVLQALSDAVSLHAKEYNADIVMYDVGPNVGPLNRVVLLDSDYFITPVAADLFSLRALSTVGRAVAKWIDDYGTIASLATEGSRQLLGGRPEYLGYITSAFKVNVGRRASNPHAQWENRIAPRVSRRVVDVLAAIDPKLVPQKGNKVGSIKHYQSLAPSAQENSVAIWQLTNLVNSGYNKTIADARNEFEAVAVEIRSRIGI